MARPVMTHALKPRPTSMHLRYGSGSGVGSSGRFDTKILTANVCTASRSASVKVGNVSSLTKALLQMPKNRHRNDERHSSA